jgi:proline racemase
VTSTNTVLAVDAHAAGEPGRVIIGGVLDVPGRTMFEKMTYFAAHHDELRLRMLREPRGYPAMCCNLLLPPTDPRAAAGFIIMEQSEYPAMSGSNTICVATVLIELGMVPVTEPVTKFALETPAGLVGISAHVEHGKATQITFENVPSLALALGVPIEVPRLGTLTVDIAYGGMVYVMAAAEAVGLRLSPDEARDIVWAGEKIRAATLEQRPSPHPENPAIVGPSISMLSGPPSGPHADLRSAVVVSSGTLDSNPDSLAGSLDRSPCGTGTSAKMATLHARGKLEMAKDFRHEGILGTVFVGRLLRETTVGGRAAVVSSISGTAWITGYARYVLDPGDPFPAGFVLGDLWAAGARTDEAATQGTRR